VLGLGQRLGHQRSLAAFGPRLAQALGRLGHVVAPLGLIELHLFLGVREEREVGERLLLAQVGGRRPAGDSAVHAAGFEDLQLRRAGLGHAAAAGRLGALGQHASAVRRRRLPARAPRLVRALVAAAAAQLHLGLHALDAAAQHSAREERMDDPRVCLTNHMTLSKLWHLWLCLLAEGFSYQLSGSKGFGPTSQVLCQTQGIRKRLKSTGPLPARDSGGAAEQFFFFLSFLLLLFCCCCCCCCYFLGRSRGIWRFPG
uniref:Uncharacterized protein n=1 Tax=Sus scrofa TaxID=9823 RepID=A0A8D1ZAY4_PIG